MTTAAGYLTDHLKRYDITLDHGKGLETQDPVALEALDDAFGGKIKLIIRLLELWRDQKGLECPSYVIEKLVIAGIQNNPRSFYLQDLDLWVCFMECLSTLCLIYRKLSFMDGRGEPLDMGTGWQEPMIQLNKDCLSINRSLMHGNSDDFPDFLKQNFTPDGTGATDGVNPDCLWPML